MTISMSATNPTEAKTPCVKMVPSVSENSDELTRQDIGLDRQSDYFYQGIVVEKAINVLSSFGQLQFFNPKSARQSNAKGHGRIFT